MAETSQRASPAPSPDTHDRRLTLSKEGKTGGGSKCDPPGHLPQVGLNQQRWGKQANRQTGNQEECGTALCPPGGGGLIQKCKQAKESRRKGRKGKKGGLNKAGATRRRKKEAGCAN